MWIVGTDDHFLRAFLQILHDLLQHEHLTGDQLLLQVALELTLAELIAFLEELLIFIDKEDTIAALE